MSLTNGMKREKAVLIKKLMLVAVCWFCMGWATAQSPLIQPPLGVQQALNQNPALAKAFNEGLTLWRNKQWRASAQAWEAIYAQVRAQYKDEHIATGLVGLYLGDSYQGMGLNQKALLLLNDAVRLHERDVGEHPSTALAFDRLGVVHRNLAQHPQALACRQRALAMYEKTTGAERPETVLALSGVAQSHGDLSNYQQALTLHAGALAAIEKIQGPSHTHTGNVLLNYAHAIFATGQFDYAIRLQKRALSIFEARLGAEHVDTAAALNNLSNTHFQLAKYDKALVYLLRSLLSVEKSQGLEHPDTAVVLNNISSVYLALGQAEKALFFQRRSLSVMENIWGSEHPNVSHSLAGLASVYEILSQNDKALPLQLRALEINEKSLGLTHPSTADRLSGLASIYFGLAQNDKIMPLLERALAINMKAFGPDHPTTAEIIFNIASTHKRLAEFEKAREFHTRALTIRENVLGSEHPKTAESMQGLASTISYLGEHEKALALQQRALATFEKTLGLEHTKTGWARANLAGTLFRTNNPEAAIVFFKSAVNTYQTQRERVLMIGAAELKSYTESIAFIYQALAHILTEQGRLDEAQLVLDMLKEDEQFEFVRRSANADPRRSRMAFNATEQAWTHRYRQVADRLAALGAEEVALQKQAKLGLTAEQQQRQKALAADLAVARQAFQAFLDELRSSFAQKGPARAVEVVETSQKALRDLQSLLKGLGDDAVLLQYYITDDKVGMLLTTPGVQLALSSQVNAKDLNRQIAEFRRLLRDPKSNPQPAAQALYQLLVAPVAQDLAQAGAKTVMLSLDGALRYVPFAALHDGQQYLAQKWNLPMYTGVTKDKLRDAVAQEWQAAALGLTQAVGEFDALPAVKAEMRSIVKDGRTGVLHGEVHLDKAFSAARLKDVSQRPFQLLHVASHFRFSPGTEVNSFLLLGDGQQLTLGDIRTQNYRFDQVDLLTLSACDTGLGGGRDAQGREIEGFGVIAQQQGAKAVLATLWPVADQSTALLMADLYKRRQSQRLTKIEALRQAQLGLMAQPRYAHPFYWAPFILMGNWK